MAGPFDLDEDRLEAPPEALDAAELVDHLEELAEARGSLEACELARQETAATSPRDGLLNRVRGALRVLRGEPPSASTSELQEIAETAEETRELLEERTEASREVLVEQFDRDGAGVRGIQ